MTSNLIRLLLVEYVVIMVVALVERKWIMALYWLGALVLNFAVLVMGGK